MKRFSTQLILFLTATFCSLAPLSVAAQDQPPPLAEEWMVTPKAGHLAEFQAALKDHTAVREAHGDPWEWQIYSSYVGDTLNQYVIRYCCTNWADVDAYAKWSTDNPEVLNHWFKSVSPHVETMQHYFSHVDWANSHWNSDAGPYRYFAVDEWTVKGGHEADFSAAKTTMSQIAKNQGWATEERNWTWATQIGGKTKAALIIGHKNFASMGADEESFAEFLGKHMGSPEAASELMKKFAGSTWGSNTTIWQHHPELSMSSDD